ncbi:MAG: SDR family oxidoreductase [Crocinitomicaceae bacterium]|nr:SDR family oxidoreductase [Crocinitomicaceae bacterium]
MKTALITGASSGIGMELAKIHASKGDHLILVARSEGKLKELASDLIAKNKIQVQIIVADLSKNNSAQEVFDQVKAKNIQVDYLINNAGFGDFNSLVDSDWNKQAMMIDLNVKSLTHLTHLFLPEMIKRKSGKIMNVASTAAFLPCPMMAVYAATKHFVLAFSEAIANEVADKGVTVTALCPGATTSGFQDAAAMHESGFMTNQKFVSAESVAQYAYKSMMKGKRVAIPGFINKATSGLIRFMPRRVVTSVARKMIDRKK